MALLGLVAGHFHSEKGDNAGIVIVVPVEFVRELLDYPKLLQWRQEREQQMSDKQKRDEETAAATADSATGSTSDYERFEALTKQLTNTPKPENKD